SFGSLRITDLVSPAFGRAMSPEAATLIGLLLFMGVMGKSAQFPFHVWLPDAMEGPTPVSALIHSATMVAAGVFLLARLFEVFALSATVLAVILFIGTLTSLMAAAMAMVQRDIKRVLAYSTVSQLGMMVMAVGAGSAVFALFHLVTHAFFKSMLFLCAGALIHHFGTNDLYVMARAGARKERVVLWCLAIGLLSLCGIPPFSGFFSKDAILHQVLHQSILYGIAGYAITFMTAYYSFRLFFILTRSAIKDRPEYTAHHQPVSLGLCEKLPLVLLAGLSVLAGFGGSPAMDDALLKFFDPHVHAAAASPPLLIVTLNVIALGAIAAFWRYRDPARTPDPSAPRSAGVRVLERKFFMDDAYDFGVKTVVLGIAAALKTFDTLIPNRLMVDQTSCATRTLGRWFSRMQSGFIQRYLWIAFAASAGLAGWLFFGRGF
ncbi:MAG: NADH-quinone oxidoreductase subunit L, partial [Candidatus Omnitrophica bacterium]|nr:NADH-quinone oxidoreductase subunit L [Candidatus Omnitrophota bacterium]